MDFSTLILNAIEGMERSLHLLQARANKEIQKVGKQAKGTGEGGGCTVTPV